MAEEKFDLQPPEPEYVAENYVISIPLDDKHFDSPWELRKYAAKKLEHQLGDEIQVTSLKVKKPNFLSRYWSRLRGQEPQAKLYLTVKF